MIKKTQLIIDRALQKVHADNGYCSLLEVTDCVELGVDLFAPVPERKGSKGRTTASGEVQISADEFSWDESSGQLSCPAAHSMRQVSRSKDPRADGWHVIERRYGDSKKHRGGGELHGRGLSRATAETGLMVVAQNTLTPYLLVKRAKTE